MCWLKYSFIVIKTRFGINLAWFYLTKHSLIFIGDNTEMKMYQIFSIGLLILTGSVCQSYGRDLEESPRLISNRISTSQRDQAKVFNNLYEQKAVILEKMTFFKNYRSNLGGLYGLGKVQKLEVMAERYENEKIARETIEVEISKLFNLMDTLDTLQQKMSGDQKMLTLQRQIMQLKDIDEINLSLPAHEEELLYYELQTTSTFRELSALPDVYGDADSWRYLYEANKDKFKDPLSLIPKGTEIVVPNIRIVEAIDISGEE